jgi:hypothetical protein
MILYKTYANNGTPIRVSVLRDAVPSDAGYDNSFASGSPNNIDQQLVQDDSGHTPFLVYKRDLSDSPMQVWPTVPASSTTPEQWP